MNLTNFSRHQKQHLQTQRMAWRSGQEMLHIIFHLDHWVVCPLFLQLVLDVLQHHPDHLDDGNDQRPKGQGASVVPGQESRSRIENHLSVLPKLVRRGRLGTAALSSTQYLGET